MPTYDYHCLNCGHQLEAFQKITEEQLKTCPKCQQDKLQRGPGGGVGLLFTGSGFYITDYGSGKPSDKPADLSSQESNNTKNSECCPCGKNQSCSSN